MTVSAKKKILVADDDQDLLDLLDLKLTNEGFEVQTVSDGKKALDSAQSILPSLIVLDLNMPKMNGMEVCKTLKTIRSTRNIPVVILTVQNEVVDRILGLEFGADDYLTKPFHPRELILRIRGILKRVQGDPESEGTMKVGELSLDVDAHEVRVGNRRVDLTSKEFQLLQCLIEKPGQVKSRDFLLSRIWEYNDKVYSRTVDTHIQRLRTKLKEAGAQIETVRGVGYRISP